MVFLNMGFDLSSFVLTLVSYFVVTATMACAGNHWDALYTCTGQVSRARAAQEELNNGTFFRLAVDTRLCGGPFTLYGRHNVLCHPSLWRQMSGQGIA